MKNVPSYNPTLLSKERKSFKMCRLLFGLFMVPLTLFVSGPADSRQTKHVEPIAITAKAGIARMGSFSDGVAVQCSGRDDTAVLGAAASAANGQGVVIANGQTCAAGDITIHHLRIERGGLLKPMTGQTITLSGYFEAGPYQTFANALPGQGTISFSGNITLGEVLTEWWGSKADGVTDFTAAFNAAKASLTNNRPGLNGAIIRLLAGNYRTSGITISDQQVHIIGSGGPGVLGSTASSTTFLSSVTNAPIIKYSGSATVYSMRARLENLTILGSTTAGGEQHGVWVDNNGILMNNVGIEKTGGHGLFLTSSSAGGYSNLEISATKRDAIRIDFSQSAIRGAGTHNNAFYRISIGGDINGDGVCIRHGNGNIFFALDVENVLGDGKGAGAAVRVSYPADGVLEPQNNMFYGVWNENNAVGDYISGGAQNNYVSYVHYSSPAPTITGNNSYRNAAAFDAPATDRGSYLLLGASETKLFPIISPPKAPTVNVSRGPGLTGAYSYKITFETTVGETQGGTTSAIVNPSNQKVHLSAIPVGPPGTTKRNIYRTAAGGADATQKYVDTIPDNTTTFYDDTLADRSLGRTVPLFNGSGSRMLLDGDGNMAQFGTTAQTSLIGPQRSDSKWPNYGFQSRPGYGMYMDSATELSFAAAEVKRLSILNTGVTDAMGGFTVGSGSTITRYLSGTASLDFAPWAGTDCQEKTISVTGAADGDTIALGMPSALASIDGVTWSAWVSAANTVKIRGCKVTAGRSADPAAETVRASVIQH
jgi:hypothetical protein